MEIIVKTFQELSSTELYELMSVRTAVFVVEQNCPYQELDGLDYEAYHVYLKDNDNITAYLRVMKKDENFAAIGRVLSTKRRRGLATLIMKEGIRVAKEVLEAESIVISAQTYARELYEKLGFVQTSDEYLEDGIPHIQMVLQI